MKTIIILLVILLLCVNIYAQYEGRVPRTATIDSLSLYSIRTATHPGSYTDDLMRYYWLKYIGEPTDSLLFDDREDRTEYFKTDVYAKEAFWGAIGHDTQEHDEPNQTPDEIMELARRHVLDTLFIPNYLDIDYVKEYVDDDSSGT